MASGSAATRYHSSTTAATVETATLTRVYRTVRVINRGTSDLFVRVNDTTDPTSTGAAEDFVVPGGREDIIPCPNGLNSTQTAVKVIPAVATAYSVIGWTS